MKKRSIAGGSKCIRHVTRKNYIMIILTAVILLCSVSLCGCQKKRTPSSAYVPEHYLRASTLLQTDHSDNSDGSVIRNNTEAALSVPTYFTKIGSEYFIVDCYHDQVIYHDNLSDPLTDWQVMTSDIHMGHTIASDGVVYLIDDTENNRVLIMEKAENENGQTYFIPTQEFTEIGNRPHYIIYDSYTDTFYVWSSQNGEMYLFRRDSQSSRVYLTQIRNIPELDNTYVRSFTIMDDKIYFVSGNSNIIEAELDSFRITNRYPVPDELAGMIQLAYLKGSYYITISTDLSGSQDYATIIQVKDLNDLSSHNYKDVYHHFIGGGTPYSITEVEGRYYLTEHRLPGHSLWSFQITDNVITDVTAVY